MSVNTGDIVLYGKYAGTELKHDGEEFIIMKESDIFAQYLKLKIYKKMAKNITFDTNKRFLKKGVDVKECSKSNIRAKKAEM